MATGEGGGRDALERGADDRPRRLAERLHRIDERRPRGRIGRGLHARTVERVGTGGPGVQHERSTCVATVVVAAEEALRDRRQQRRIAEDLHHVGGALTDGCGPRFVGRDPVDGARDGAQRSRVGPLREEASRGLDLGEHLVDDARVPLLDELREPRLRIARERPGDLGRALFDARHAVQELRVAVVRVLEPRRRTAARGLRRQLDGRRRSRRRRIDADERCAEVTGAGDGEGSEGGAEVRSLPPAQPAPPLRGVLRRLLRGSRRARSAHGDGQRRR